MQHTLTGPPLPSTSNESPGVFKVVIAYEDFETGKHAKRTYDFLVDTLGGDCRFENQMWKFDVLNLPKLRQMAAEDAAAAEIVVVSCHGDELPPQVKDWIESWLGGPNRPLALVALFDPPHDDQLRTCAVREYLADVARRGGMEFFPKPEEWPGKPRYLNAVSGTNLDRRALSVLGGASGTDTTARLWLAD